MKSIYSGIFASSLSFIVMFGFLFIATGFAPEECLITTSSDGCTGIVSIFPYSIRLLILFGITTYSVYLGYDEYKKHKKETIINLSSEKSLEEYRKRHNITPISTKGNGNKNDK